MSTTLFIWNLFLYLRCATRMKVKVKVEGYDTNGRTLCTHMCMTLEACGILSCVPVVAAWALRHYGFGANILPLLTCNPGRQFIVPTSGPLPNCSSIHCPSQPGRRNSPEGPGHEGKGGRRLLELFHNR